MTGYEMPLRAIREQIASAVDIIVHTARLKDGSRRVTNITEVYGIEDDEILTQDVFAFEQTGVVDGKIQGDLQPDRRPAHVHGPVQGQRRRAAARRLRHPARGPRQPGQARIGKGRSRLARAARRRPPRRPHRSAWAGGDGRRHGLHHVRRPRGPRDGRVVSARSRCRRASASRTSRRCSRPRGTLAGQDRVGQLVPARPGRVRAFSEEWVKWFPGDAPVGQGTLMPPQQRRAGFRSRSG